MGVMFHIDDTNFTNFTGDGSQITVDGVTRYLSYRGKMPNCPYKFRSVAADYPIIPKSGWVDAIKAKKQGLRALADQAGIKVKDQNGLGYCWIYASTECVEWAMVKQGQKWIELCPESAGGPATGWRNEGGYAEEALKQLQTAGAAPAAMCPSPHSLNPKSWDANWKTEALKYRITEAWEMSTIEEVMTLLINDFPCSVGINWWGHEILFLDAILDNTGTPVVLFRNSWGNWGDNGYSTMSIAKASDIGGAFACRAVLLS